jgi:hypothetical protein
LDDLQCNWPLGHRVTTVVMNTAFGGTAIVYRKQVLYGLRILFGFGEVATTMISWSGKPAVAMTSTLANES